MLFSNVLIFIVIFASASSYKILGIFEHPGRSHFEVFKPLLVALAERGHEVTTLGYFPSKTKIPRYKDVVLKFPGNSVQDTVKLVDFQGARFEKILGANFIHGFATMSCQVAITSKAYKDLYNSTEKFDLIISEFFNTNCLLTAIAEKWKVPIIGITSHALMPWTNRWVGNPDNPAYIPSIFMDYSDKLTFIERVENTLMWIYTTNYFVYMTEKQDTDFIQQHIRKGPHNPSEIMLNTSLILTNTHFTVHRPRPLVPGVIEVAGIHLEKLKKIPTVGLISFFTTIEVF